VETPRWSEAGGLRCLPPEARSIAHEPHRGKPHILRGSRGRQAALAVAAPFWAWASATTIVAAGEEILLRGALFAACEAGWGAGGDRHHQPGFALMHLPTYGLPAFPLDLGVGLVPGGLRVLSGGPGAPAVAHLAADLAAWFL